MKKAGKAALLAVCAVLMALWPMPGVWAGQAPEEKEALEQLIENYREYEARFAAIEKVSDIEECGFHVIEEQSFPVILESFGEEEVTFLPVLDREYSRMAVLIADSGGNILYKTNQLETNNRRLGELKQPTKGIAAVSFQDLNRDGLTDIILITDCKNETGEYKGRTYKTGDVLFQQEGGFYRDWRVSDKINRFSMNKSVDFIVSYVRDGISVEVLYTATTLDELLYNGFELIEEQCYWCSFEKQGTLRVVPGFIRMAEYNVFMIYLVNDQGSIVWSFQTMEDYDNLYSMKGMARRDLDGDGMKDILVLARYSYSGPDGEMLIDTKCSVFYQRTDGFAEDTEFEDYHQCTTEDTVSGLVEMIRGYWGWTVEND